MKTFHKTFGQIEILSQDENVTIAVVISTGEEKKLMTKFLSNVTSDTPFEEVEKKTIIIERKQKKAKKPLTAAQKLKNDREHSRFMAKLNMSVLQDNFLDCQIISGNYNIDLIR